MGSLHSVRKVLNQLRWRTSSCNIVVLSWLLLHFVDTTHVVDTGEMLAARTPRMDRFNSVLELAKQMKKKSDDESSSNGILTTKDFMNRWGRGPGKALSGKTLPLDRAIAEHLKFGEGISAAYVPEAHHSANFSTNTNATIYYKLYGDGPSKVIMVMGLSASHSGWEYILPILAPKGSPYQICVFDNRGIGKSFSPESSEQYCMEYFARDVINLADNLGWKNFHLVGFSMGGMISQQVLYTVPERVLSVAFLSTSSRRTLSEQIPPVAELGTLISWAMARSKEEKALADLRLHFDDAYLDREFVKGTTIRDFWNYVYLSERAEDGEVQAWHGFKGQMSALLAFKMRKEMFAAVRKRFHGHMLVMHGTKDRIINCASGKNLHDYFVKGLMNGTPGLPQARCRLRTVEAGHFLPIQKRREVAAELLELWSRSCQTEQGVDVAPSKAKAAGLGAWLGALLHRH